MVGKKILMSIVCMLIFSFMVGCEKEERIKIGLTQFVSHEALDSCREGFIAGLKSEGFDNDKVKFILSNAQGDVPTTNLIASDLVDRKVDLIMAIATPSAQAVKNVTEDTDIPVLFSAVTDPVKSGLVTSLENPGGNVTGTSDKTPIDKQFLLIKELFADAKKIGFVYSLGEPNSVIQLDDAKKEAEKHGFTISEKGVTTSSELADALDILLEEIDVLYIPTDNLVASSMTIVNTKALTKKIPVIGSERAQVENGALITEGISYYELGFQTGLMAARILKGEKPNDIPVEMLNETELVININTAESLGLTLPQELLDRAVLIEE